MRRSRPESPSTAVLPARSVRSALSALVLTGAAAALLAAPAAGQVLPTRVVPISRADDVDMLPSRGLAMGGVGIAFRDTLADLWSNPAAGLRLSGAYAFGSPAGYEASRRTGEGGAVPVGVVGRRGAWFGAGALALQSVEPGRPGGGSSVPVLLDGGGSGAAGLGAAPSEESVYAFALLGRSWDGLAVGASVVAARRHAVDGIGLLYGESAGLDAAGDVATFRLGVLGEWSDGRSLEAVAAHSRTRMAHELVYADFTWDPETQFQTMTPRSERNAEEADVWALRVVHQRPLGDGWRIGWRATANLASYPTLPRYDAPRDGVTDLAGGSAEARAYELGVGFVRESGPVTLGADVAYEPIRSRVRGEEGGSTTVANRIRYSNGSVRLGAAREFRPEGAKHAVDVRVGLAARLVDYRLAQFDHRQGAGRDEHRTWMEWTPTWGGGIRFAAFEVRYHGSVLHGTERPGAGPDFSGCIDFCLAEPAIAPWPAGSLMEPRDVTVSSHQLFVSYTLGGAR